MAIALFALIPAADQPTVNAVLAYLASGADAITAPHADPSDPATITTYCMLDMGASQDKVDEFSAMAEGVVPTLTAALGEEGLPTHSEFIDAASRMIVVAGYNIDDPAPFIAAQRSGFDVVPWDPGI